MGQKKTGNPLKSFTLWYILLGVTIVFLNLRGQYSKWIMMLHLNPVLVFLYGMEDCREYIGSIPGLWHFLSIATMTGYGLLLDGCKHLIKFINANW